tara:strand:- start:1230 stop:1520 length:291 start_codon:yes stop_codon:yes gene_type:complete
LVASISSLEEEIKAFRITLNNTVFGKNECTFSEAVKLDLPKGPTKILSMEVMGEKYAEVCSKQPIKWSKKIIDTASSGGGLAVHARLRRYAMTHKV